VVQFIILHNQETCNASIGRSKDAIHEVFLCMEDVSELFSSMNPSVLFDLHKYYPKAFLVFQQHKQEYIFNVIRENISRGIKEGLYREELDMDIITRFRLESTLIPFNPDFFNAVKSSMVNISETLTYHFLYGIVSIKGYKLIQKYETEKFKK
jgi:hypothetical protein